MQQISKTFLRNAARVVSTVSAIVVVTLVGIFLFDNPYKTAGMNHGTQWIMYGIVVLSLVAVDAAWKTRPLRLAICFAISFVPVGFYLLLTPGLFALVGVAHLGFLLAALLLAKSSR